MKIKLPVRVFADGTYKCVRYRGDSESQALATTAHPFEWEPISSTYWVEVDVPEPSAQPYAGVVVAPSAGAVMP